MDIKYELTMDRAHAKDSLRCLLSCILFHRLLGPSIPQSREALGVTYPCVSNSSLDSLVEEKTSQLLRDMQTPQGQIGVQFYDKQHSTLQAGQHQQRPSSWFGTSSVAKEVCWEQWVIKVTLLDGKNDQEREKNRQNTEKQLHDTLLAIITTASSNKEHIPPITTTDSTPFPYKIVVNNGPAATKSNRQSQQQEDTWGAVFKKMLE